MNDERLTKSVTHGQLLATMPIKGKPLFRYKDKLKDNVKYIEILASEFEEYDAD